MTKSLLIIAVGQAAFRFAVIGYGTDCKEATFVLPWSVAGRLLEFGLGANAAVLLGDNVLAKRPAWNASALFGGALLAFGLATVCKRLLGVSHPVTDLMWTLGFWSLIVSAAFPRGVLRRWMSFAPLAKIGVFSYSVYLVHEFVLGHVMSALASLSHTKAVPWVLAPVAIGLTLIPGYVFYRVVEQPAIDFFRARLQVRLSAPPAR
jgi:peptidoglycan/LPS O-acetylase OafA/YrhL